MYRKPTHTNRYLHAKSHHHPAQKDGLVHTLVQRAIRLCESKYLNKELNILKNALESNGYDKYQIQKVINKKSRTDNTQTYSQDDTQYTNTAVLPFIQGVTNKIGKLLKKHQIRTVYSAPLKIKTLLRPIKGRTEGETHGIYKITCPICEKVYVGVTSRNINTRMSEHERACRLGYPEKSAIAEHYIETGHKIHIKPEILATPPTYYTRMTREAIEIFKHPHNINRDDGQYLQKAWHTVIKKNIKNTPHTTI